MLGRKIGPSAQSRWNWVAAFRYFALLLGIGLIASYASSIFLPEASIGDPPFNGSDTKAHLAIGAFVVVLLSPVIAVFRHWRPFEFFVSVSVASGLLLANLGLAVGLAILSAILYYGMQWLLQMVAYFRS
jgi:hypothetical protein